MQTKCYLRYYLFEGFLTDLAIYGFLLLFLVNVWPSLFSKGQLTNFNFERGVIRSKVQIDIKKLDIRIYDTNMAK